MPGPRRPVRRPATLVAVGLVAVLGLAACSDDPAPTSTAGAPSSSTSSSPTPSASASASESPAPSPSDTASATASPSGSASPGGFSTDDQQAGDWPGLGPDVGVGVAIRVGRHSGYDRVVYEFSGTSRPSYRVRYVDEPKDSVSGDTIDAEGDAFLQVEVSSVATPSEDDPIPSDPSDASLANTVVTYAPALWGGFEGVGEQFIGVEGERRPFRVGVLEEPTRLVVDIAK